MQHAAPFFLELNHMKQHTSRFIALVAEAKTRIHEITPIELKSKIEHGESFYLIDVREESEWNTGYLPTAIHLSKGIIERDIEKSIPDVNAEIIVYCSGGFRGCLVADNLQKMGYINVASLAGGSSAWVNAGYPMDK